MCILNNVKYLLHMELIKLVIITDNYLYFIKKVFDFLFYNYKMSFKE